MGAQGARTSKGWLDPVMGGQRPSTVQRTSIWLRVVDARHTVLNSWRSVSGQAGVL
jgi:hypothetical protein